MTASVTKTGDFTNQAEAYATARPGYPATLIRELMADAGVHAGDEVMDIGAGTGIAAALLAAEGLHVTAVEPNAGMRSQAAPMANVRWVDGTFEHLPLADASQRWATAAQAFHWADPRKALPEVARVLRPGARFTIFWNNRDMQANEPLRLTRRIMREISPGFSEGHRDNQAWEEILQSTGDFAGVHRLEAGHVVRLPRRNFVELWRSHNRLCVKAGDRLEELLGRIDAMLIERGVREVEMPYICRAWSAMRK